MATKQIGIVAPVPMGEWSSGQKYNVLNIVTNNSSTYMAKKSSTGIQPGVTEGWRDYWMVLFNVQADDVATKAYVTEYVEDSISTAADNYVQKTTGVYKLYGTSGSGDTTYTLSNSALVAGYVPVRYTNGNLIVPVDPGANNHAASKQYVDALVPASASIDSAGLITFRNSSGTTLFTLQLPSYNGGVE